MIPRSGPKINQNRCEPKNWNRPAGSFEQYAESKLPIIRNTIILESAANNPVISMERSGLIIISLFVLLVRWDIHIVLDIVRVAVGKTVCGKVCSVSFRLGKGHVHPVAFRVCIVKLAEGPAFSATAAHC